MKNFLKQNPKQETRLLVESLELRSGDGEDSRPKVVGYAAKFDKESSNLGSEKYQFREIIKPGAFDDVLKDDTRALFNHDPSLILARSKNGEGTLDLAVDEVGLRYEFEIPDTSAGRDLHESLKRGDVDQSSFGFIVAPGGDVWEERSDEDGKNFITRTINKIGSLLDVSPVTYPAYPDASVALRSLEQFQKENRSEEEPPEDPETPPAEDPPTEDPSIGLRQRQIDLIDKPAD